MIRQVKINSIQYESETTTIRHEHAFENDTIAATIVTATIQLGGVFVEGKYKFDGILDSRNEIIEKIDSLYK